MNDQESVEALVSGTPETLKHRIHSLWSSDTLLNQPLFLPFKISSRIQPWVKPSLVSHASAVGEKPSFFLPFALNAFYCVGHGFKPLRRNQLSAVLTGAESPGLPASFGDLSFSFGLALILPAHRGNLGIKGSFKIQRCLIS